MSTDAPLSQVENTFFFRIVEAGYHAGVYADRKKKLIHIMHLYMYIIAIEHTCTGMDVLGMLPDLDLLLSSAQLQDAGLTGNSVFEFLMRAGYEQLERVGGADTLMNASQ